MIESNAMKEQIISILQDILPGEDVTESTTLADDGRIDSLAVVELVTEFSIAFDVEIPFSDLVNENFNSAEAMEAMILRLQQGT
ncbi:MAG: acyl carrier protein [Bacillota bacterium]|jgi:acyl carrier protein|nr:acyl carrier protein [Bacillota bacterium]